MATRQASLKYPFAQYTVYANRIGAGIPENEIRKEYTRLRDILSKRIKTIQKSEFRGQGIAGQFPTGLPKLSEIRPEDLPYMLQHAATAIRSNIGSLTGLRRRRSETLASLRESGYRNITEDNIEDFAKFMEESRDRGLEMVYGSDNVASLYDATVAVGLDPEDIMNDFDWWLTHQDEVEEAMERLRNKGEETTAADIRRELM